MSRIGNTVATKLICCGSIIVGIAGFFGTMHVVQNKEPRTFHEAAKKWCKSVGGEFWDGIISYTAKQPECKVPRYKGLAGIFDGYDTWEFSYMVKDYDTGYTEVYKEPRNPIIFRLNSEEDKRQYAEYMEGKRTPVITFITKGKNN